jgi:hypothetical protein
MNERVKSHPLMSRLRCFEDDERNVKEPEEDDNEEGEEEVSAKLK